MAAVQPKQAVFRLSPAPDAFFAGEAEGDLVLYPGTSNQRLLLGNAGGHAPILTLDSNYASIAGDLATRCISTAGITIFAPGEDDTFPVPSGVGGGDPGLAGAYLSLTGGTLTGGLTCTTIDTQNNAINAGTGVLTGKLAWSNLTSVPTASTTLAGVVQLDATTSSASTTAAATANAVKKAYDLAVTALSIATGTYNNAITGSTLHYTVAGQTRLPSMNMCLANYTLVIASTGLHAWGYNSCGQLGDGTTTHRSAPVAVSSFGSISGKTVVAISGGSEHTVALDSTGGVHAWGSNGYGQLGDDTTDDRWVPVSVSSFGSLSGKTVVAITTGRVHTVALDSTGGVHAWGTNYSGQLGDNTTTSRSVPVSVSSFGSLAGKTVVAISCGGSHTVALDSTGGVHAWGYNDYGRLGDGTTTNSTVPVSVSSFGSLGGKTVVAIAVGYAHAVALDSTGGVHAWGYNGSGRLGDGTMTNSSVPIAVSSFGSLIGKTVVAISCGGSHTVVLDSTGGVHAWGGNYSGQLGDGTTTNSTVPVSVSSFGSLGGKTVVAIAVGYAHTVALDSMGGVHAWGDNYHGQIGDGTTAQRTVPVFISTPATAVKKAYDLANASWGDQDLVPTADSTYDLGAPEKRWKDLYLSGRINFGDGLVIDSQNWSYLLNHVVPPKIDKIMRKLFKGVAQDHSAYIKAGEVWAFGNNDAGQLGLGDTTLRRQPTKVPGITDAVAVACGESFTVVLKSDWTAVAFGLNSSGQLGDGTTTNRLSPVAVKGISGAIAIAVGLSHSLFLLSDGDVKGFGSNARGQLGVTTLGTVNTAPVRMNLPASDGGGTLKARSIAAGAYHSVALLDNGAAYTCGDNLHNQLGADGAVTPYASTPGVVPSISDVVHAACGDYHTILIGYDGQVLTCGRNDAGQLGLGHKNVVTTFVSAIAAPGASNPSAGLSMEADAGLDHTIVLKADETVVVFGSNAKGQLGLGPTVAEQLLPATLVGYPGYRVAAGKYHTIVLLTQSITRNNVIVAFGDNTFGQMGDADSGITTRWIPNVIYESVFAKKLGTGCLSPTTGVVDTDGVLYMCGDNSDGLARGDGSMNNARLLAPVVMSDPDLMIVQVAAGSGHTVALDSTGGVHAWGNNYYGQLGNNTTTISTVPFAVSSFGSISGKTVVAISGGSDYTVALDSTGGVHAWGSNGYGQLGDDTTDDRWVPVAVSSFGSLSGKTVVAISAGGSHTVALDSTGGMHAWGYNGYGQLGDGISDDRWVPVSVSSFGSLSGKTVVAIAAGADHTVALDSTGGVHAWGNNRYGQLGDDTTTDRSVPVSVSSFGSLSGKTVVAIATGAEHTVALDSTGGVHAWGINWYGQLGDDTTTDRSVPVAVSSFGSLIGKTVVAISGGSFHTVALDSTGGVHAWGNNHYGQLGDGTVAVRIVPVSVDKSVFTEYSKKSSEGSFGAHKLFMRRLDLPTKLQAVGVNTYGQLGDGTTTDRYTAITLTFPADVVASATGDAHSACVLSDGSLHTWGRNNSGQCGVSNGGASVVTPTKIHRVTNAKAVACGAEFTLVLLADRTVLAFGLNTSGQLGLAAGTTSTSTPTAVPGLVNIAKLSAGGAFAVALDTTGHISTWGSNLQGATGRGVNTGSTFGPTAIALSDKAVDVAAGSHHLVVVLETGQVLTCGLNQHGQLGRADSFGSDTANSTLEPTADTGTMARAIQAAADGGHTAVLLNNGCMRTFGANDQGQLDAIAGPDQWTPRDASVRSVRAVSTALNTTFYEKDDTLDVYGFGVHKTFPVYKNAITGSTVHYTVAGQTRLPSMNMCRAIHTLVIASTGLHAWGNNGSGRIGDGTTTNKSVPVSVSSFGSLGGKTVVAIATGYSYTVALDSTGGVHAWGLNSSGQLGDGTTTQRSVPVAVSSFGSLSGKTVVAIAGGSDHTVALDSTGGVHAWGNNGSGRLGDDTTTDRSVPVAVSSFGSLSGKTVVAIAAGEGHTVALDSTGGVHAWGYNVSGGIGDSTTTNRSVPVAVSSFGSLIGKTVVAIAAGIHFTVALDSTGGVHAWGFNNSGQLGDGTTTNRLVPVAVSSFGSLSGKTVVAIAGGYAHTLALDSTGGVHAWGSNVSGRLGDGTTDDRSVPVSVSSFGSLSGKTVVAIAAGEGHTVALDSTGGVHAWGANWYGQLGDGTTTGRKVPVFISTMVTRDSDDYFINFTGQHRCFVDGITGIPALMAAEGRIVVSDRNAYVSGSRFITGKGAITVNDALPVLSFSSRARDKRVFGVVSVKPNDDSTILTDADIIRLAEVGDIRAQINSVGEGAIWVADVNGAVEAGDYITSSDLRGYGMKQDEPFMINYTVAKATMDCDFTAPLVPAKEVVRDENGNVVVDAATGRPTWRAVMDTRVEPPVEKMEAAYTMRYVSGEDLGEMTKEEYDTRKAGGDVAVFRVALIGCTYHCG